MKTNQCPSCNCDLPPSFAEPVLREQLKKAGDETTRLRGELQTLRKASDRANEQEADIRSRLKRDADNARLEADHERMVSAALRVELQALRRVLMPHPSDCRECKACQYVGQLVDGDYCKACGENVTTQHANRDGA